MDGWETLVFFVVALVAILFFLLVVLLKPQAIEVSFQHAAVFKLVVCPSLMVRAGLL